MKGNAKRVILILGSVCSTIVICVVFGFFGQAAEDVIMNRIVGVVAIISGMGSFLVGISSIFTTSLDNVREYFATGEDAEIADARHALYNYRNIKIKFGKSVYDSDFNEWLAANITKEDKDYYIESKEQIFTAASRVANFYQMWGLLQYRNFLPIWVFDTTSGYNMIRLYQAVADIIERKRDANPLYASHFEDLCKRINKKYKKVIGQCRDSERKMFITKHGIENPDANATFSMKIE